MVLSLHLLSYGMRYMAKILRMSLAEKFPKAPAEEVDKVPWGWGICVVWWGSAVSVHERSISLHRKSGPLGLKTSPSQHFPLSTKETPRVGVFPCTLLQEGPAMQAQG